RTPSSSSWAVGIGSSTIGSTISRPTGSSTRAKSSPPTPNPSKRFPAFRSLVLQTSYFSSVYARYGTVHLHDEGAWQGLSPRFGGLQRYLPLVLLRREDRRDRREWIGQVHAAAHHGRARPALPR